MAPPRIRVTASPDWEVLAPAARMRLPALARAWEKKRFAEAHVPLGLVRLSAEGEKLVASRIGRPSFPRAKAKGLLFLHGTFSHASAAFSDLARDGGFEALSKLYEGRVFAFNHLTVGRSPQENATALLEAVRGASLDSSLDIVTHSRGGLVARLLASSAGAPRVNRVFLAASPHEGTPLGSPQRGAHPGAPRRGPARRRSGRGPRRRRHRRRDALPPSRGAPRGPLRPGGS